MQCRRVNLSVYTMKVKLFYTVLGKLSVYSAGGALLYKAVGWSSLSIQCRWHSLCIQCRWSSSIQCWWSSKCIQCRWNYNMQYRGSFLYICTNRNINELELGGALTAYEDLLPSSVWSQSGILPTRAVINAVSSGARSSDVWRTSWWLARVELSYYVTTLLVMREKPKIRRPQ